MPRLNRSAHSRPAIGDLRDWVVVCTTVEKPDGDVSVILKRPDVFGCHARVLPLRGEKVLDYRTVLGSDESPSHEITIRTPLDAKIDIRHWVFLSDRFGSSWFKVVSVEDLGGVHRFSVLLVARDTVRDSRSDPATQEIQPVGERPDVPVII